MACVFVLFNSFLFCPNCKIPCSLGGRSLCLKDNGYWLCKVSNENSGYLKQLFIFPHRSSRKRPKKERRQSPAQKNMKTAEVEKKRH